MLCIHFISCYDVVTICGLYVCFHTSSFPDWFVVGEEVALGACYLNPTKWGPRIRRDFIKILLFGKLRLRFIHMGIDSPSPVLELLNISPTRVPLNFIFENCLKLMDRYKNN